MASDVPLTRVRRAVRRPRDPGPASLLRALAAGLVVASLAFSPVANAEPTPQEKETARALMDQGDEHFEEKKYDAALKAYLGAHAIMRVPTTALEVAKAHEALGHLVEARDALLEAFRYPKTDGEPAAFTSARAEAEHHASVLALRIASLVVSVAGQPSGAELRVSVDGVALPPAASSLPIKVNPGHHTIVVSSDATIASRKDVVVEEGQVLDVPFTLTERPASELRADAGRGSILRTAGLITAGAGVVGLAVGTFFGLRASGKQDDANCPDNRCPDDASASVLREANDAATVSTLGFVAGGVLAASGVTLWVLGDRARAPTEPRRVSGLGAGARTWRLVTFGTAGLAAVGSF